MEDKKVVMGWVSFGLGIATWVLVWFSIVFSPAAVVLGILSLLKEKKHWSAIVGLTLGGLSLITMILGIIFLDDLLNIMETLS